MNDLDNEEWYQTYQDEIDDTWWQYLDEESQFNQQQGA
jgi:hypothetical protein|tara:strand:- start:5069 stop:5182 length:114 start_codon:yes stop_codon:yes gene_type:complete